MPIVLQNHCTTVFNELFKKGAAVCTAGQTVLGASGTQYFTR